MRWKRGASTKDVIDVRGGGGGRRGGAALPVGGGLGVVGVILFVAIQLLGGGGGAGGFNIPAGFDSGARAPSGEPIPPSQDPDRDLKDFSVYVFNNAQATWERVFDAAGRDVRARQARPLRDRVDTGCGSASSSVGPFYCPADQLRVPRPLLLPRHGAPAAARAASSPGPT